MNMNENGDNRRDHGAESSRLANKKVTPGTLRLHGNCVRPSPEQFNAAERITQPSDAAVWLRHPEMGQSE